MLHLPSCILVAFVLLPLMVQADRLDTKKKQNRSATHESSLTWANSSITQTVFNRRANVDMPISLVGSGTFHHKFQNKLVGNARDMHSSTIDDTGAGNENAKAKKKYGICCLPKNPKNKEVQQGLETATYIEPLEIKEDRVSKEQTPQDTYMEGEMEKCSLLGVVEDSDAYQNQNGCQGFFNNSVEFQETRERQLKKQQSEHNMKMNEATKTNREALQNWETNVKVINDKINNHKTEHAEKVHRLRAAHTEKVRQLKEALDRDLQNREDKLKENLEKEEVQLNAAKSEVEKINGYIVQAQNSKEEFEKQVEEATEDVSRLKNQVKLDRPLQRTRSYFLESNSQTNRYGVCCQLAGQENMYILKPSAKFVNTKCEKAGLWTYSKLLEQDLQCGQGKKTWTKNAFFRPCPECSDTKYKVDLQRFTPKS
mmetsp:Transcript_115296/g.229762  ORF Transcript_115296/g.229762 Transcript_115296/m.229762 type:complete len:426 (-) Transcript_115296:72-1349(-)